MQRCKQSYNYQVPVTTHIFKNKMADTDLIYQIVECIFAGIGLIANGALFVIYLKKDRKVRFNQSMLLLISWDTLFIVSMLIQNFATLETDLSLMTLFYRGSFDASVLTTTLIALEQFMILCRNK